MDFHQYINLFRILFHTGIPRAVIIFTFIAATCISVYSHHRKSKDVLAPWVVACLFLILYSTLLGRLDASSGLICSNGSNIHLMPFWSIQAIQEGYIETLYEKIYNVLFFVPYGVLLGLNGSNSSSSSKGSKGMKGAVLIGFLTSVGIEFLQFITRTGTCETDDVICNTLGCSVGVVIGVGICRMIGKIRNK